MAISKTASLKRKHLILYFIMFALLIYSDIPGGALISLAAWFQMTLLIWKKEYTGKNQILTFIYFLTLIPLFIFLGSSSTFAVIYLKDYFFMQALLSLILTFILSTLVIITSVFSADYFLPESNIMAVYKNSFNKFKLNFKLSVILSLIMTLLITIPFSMRQDYKISLVVILIHLYLNQKQLRDLIFEP